MRIGPRCPERLPLQQYLSGLRSGAAARPIEEHLLHCSACQAAAAAPGTDALLGALARKPSTDELVEEKAVAQLIDRLRSATLAETASRRGDTSSPRGLADKPVLEPPQRPDEIGRLNGYRVLRCIGRGGMGIVYEAEDETLCRRVALKVMACAAAVQARERFLREAQAAAALQCDHVVPIHQVGEGRGAGGEPVLYLVMPLLEGESLEARCQREPQLPVAEVVRIGREAALGLAAAHARGLVHRDIKPANIWLEASPGRTPGEGRVKILDFGLARFAREQERRQTGQLTSAGMVMGTADYIAPEQTRDASRSDIRADIYSLGCTLYQLLTGQVPFPEGTAVDKMLRHSLEEPPSLAALRPDVPPALVAVVEKMMAKDPAQRYQTPAEVVAALEACAEGAAPKPARRRRGPVVAALVAAAAVLLGAVVYRIQTDNGELVITAESDDVEVVVKQGGKLVRIIDTRTDREVTLALRSGTYELELKGDPVGLKLSLDKATLKRGEKVLARVERLRERPPGGDTDVATLKPLHAIEWAAGEGFGVADVSPDGRYFLVTRRNLEHVRVWETDTGKMVREIDGALIARFTPDGKQIVAHSWDPNDDFHAHDVETGKLLRRFGDKVQTWNFVLSWSGTRLFDQTPGAPRVWDWRGGEKICEVSDGATGTDKYLFTPDGAHILHQRGSKAPLLAYDAGTGKEVETYSRLRDLPPLVNISADGKRLHCNAGTILKVFDVATGKEVCSLDRGPGAWGLLVGDGQRLLTNLHPDAVGLWDVDAGRLVAKLQFPETVGKHLRDYRASADGKVIAFAVNPDMLYVFRLPDVLPAPPAGRGQAARPEFTAAELPAAPGHLRTLARPSNASAFHPVVSPDGRLLLLAVDSPVQRLAAVRLVEAATGRTLRDLGVPGHLVTDAAFTPDSKHVLMGTTDNEKTFTFRLWDLATAESRVLDQVGPVEAWPAQFQFSADGQRFVTLTAAPDGQRYARAVYDFSSGKLLARIDPPEDQADYDVVTVVSADGTRAVSALWPAETNARAGARSEVRITPLDDGQSRGIDPGSLLPMTPFADVENGQVGALCWDAKKKINVIQTWDLASGKPVRRAPLETKDLAQAMPGIYRCTPNGRRVLVLGQVEETRWIVRVFDAAGKELFQTPPGPPVAARCSDDGRLLATWDRTEVQLYRLTDGPGSKPE